MKIREYSKRFIHYYSEEIPEFIENFFQTHDFKSFVDLGCGDGPLLYSLHKQGYLDNIEKIAAVDISAQRIKNVKNIDEKITCIISDACALTAIPNESFDLAISQQVIEHVKDEKQCIDEAFRILKPEGWLCLSTVFKKWYGWYFYRCNGRWTLDPTHLREYTQKSQLLNLLEKNHFEIVEDKMHLQWFAITDFILKRFGFDGLVYKNKVMRFLRKIKVPIFGYYNWELVLRKRKIS